MALRVIIPRWKIFKLQARRIFDTSLTLVAMVTIALVCALLTLRLSIHGFVHEVPNVSGMTLDEAQDALRSAHLKLTLENRFYSATVPSGRVLSQSPVAGTKVRTGWYVRVTESTGAQKVSIPDTVGQNSRDAAMAIRRSLLELGTMAHLPAPGENDVVLAQTPPPNAEGVDKPQVSILLSAPEGSDPAGYVMPNLVGMSLKDAQKLVTGVGLKLVAIAPAAAAVVKPPTIVPVGPMGTGSALPVPVAAPAPILIASGNVVSQTPKAGYHITGEETIKVITSLARAVTPTVVAPAAVAPSSPVAKPAMPVRPVVPQAKPLPATKP